MSGDGQPRKRRDKRRRKGQVEARRAEEYAEEREILHQLSTQSEPEEEELYPNLKDTDEVIHVHKDAHTGGNIVTKIIFFLLMGGLVIMIGFILMEHRGTTDEDHDLSARETPWSLQFQDWSNLLTVPDIVPKLFSGDNIDRNNRKRHSGDEIDNHVNEHEDEHEDDQSQPHSAESSWFDLELLSWGSSAGGEEAAETEEVDEAEVTSSWFDMSFFTGSADVTEEPTQEVLEDSAESEEVDKAELSSELEEEEERNVSDEVDNEGEELDDDRSEEELDRSEEELGDNKSEEELDRSEEELGDNKSEEELDRSEEELGDNKSDEELDVNKTDENEVEEDENVAKEEVDKEENEDLNQILEDEPISASEHDEDEVKSYEPLDDQEEQHMLSIGEEEAKSNEDNDEDPRGSVFPQKSSIVEEDEDDSNEQVEPQVKNSGAQYTSEELFPEAIQALQREAFELLKEQKEEAERVAFEAELAEEESETEEDLPSEVVEEETEGTPEAVVAPENGAQITSPTVQIVPPTPPPSQVPPPIPESPKTPQHPAEGPIVAEEVRTSSSVPSLLVPEYDEESEPEEEVEEEEEDEDLSEDASPINPKIYEELIAKYGQPTPESSDAEASDDGIREYSDGGEVESVGEEESGGELEDSEPEEEEEDQRWTSNDLHDVKKMIETESEGDEEEEDESEDEPPPMKKPVQGGGKSMDEQPSVDEEEALLRWQLQQAEEEFNYERPESALNLFRKIVESHPTNVIALYGIARALDRLAEMKKSNDYLQQAIDAYLTLLSLEVIDDAIFVPVAQRAINRLRFKGLHMKAVAVHKKLVDKFNYTVEYRNDLAINYLMVNRLSDAEQVFLETLKLWPDDPVARSHYGLALKLSGKVEESIPHLLQGLSHNHPGTKDARLFFHLGDALSRSGRSAEASEIYKDGVNKGLFRSEYQRSLYNVDHLTSRPWWTLKETTYEDFFKILELNWKIIRDEGLSAMKLKGSYQDEAENLRDVGDWKQFQLYARGSRYGDNCKKTPITCKIIENFSPAKSCKRGQSKFSIMENGTHVWPHCGPTNCRLRAHLGLVVPPGPAIRVANETRKWAEGKVIVFDDSFEHEVWHNGTSFRLVLIVDVWHPDLSSAERAGLSPI